MPIVTVQIVCAAGEALATSTAQELADRIGTALQAAPGHVWVRLECLGRESYAENHAALGDAELPVFVTVLLHEQPRGDALRAQALAVATAVANGTGRPPGRVHVLFDPPGAGRVAFGGVLRDGPRSRRQRR